MIVKQEKGEFQYENPQCIITYNFWSNGGTADFEFYNKTDDIVYVDLTKSFYVRNDVANDLYRARTWTHTEGRALSVEYDYVGFRSVGVIQPNATLTSTVVETNTITMEEKQFEAIPAHSKKYFKTYKISYIPILSCDLQRYPSHKARQVFSSENSPCRFSDVITYYIGDNTAPVTITNEFFVSSVTNYAEPEVVVMKKRKDVCENMRDPDYVAPEKDLYDKVVRDSICNVPSSFYNIYQTTTEKQLYKDTWEENYTYDYKYNAYVKGGGGSRISTMGIIGIIAGFVGTIGLLEMTKHIAK